METNRAYNHPVSRKGGAFMSMDQNGQRPYQYSSPSFYESATAGRQLGVFEKYGYNGQHGEGQERNQIQPERGAERIRALEKLVMSLKTQLDEEKTEKQYYKGKAMEFYKKLCMHDPRMLAECQRRAQVTQLAAAAAAANAASSPSAPTYSAALLPSFRSPASPSSAALPSVPSPSALLSSAKASAIPPSVASSPTPRQTAVRPVTPPPAPRETAIPPVTFSSNPRQPAVPSATSSFAPHQTAVHSVTRSPAPSPTAAPAVAHLSTPLGPASPVAAPPIFIDLTIEKSPSCSPSRSQKRKRAPEQESDEGFNARKKILSKSFDWMKPKDRPNFQTKNPYQPESTGFETESDQYDYGLGQARQENLLPQSQAPAHPPASVRLSDFLGTQHSNTRTRKTNTRKRQETAKTRRQEEARERLKTKKKQIMNVATAEKTEGQEAEDYDAIGEEMEAELEKETEDVDKMAEEMEAELGMKAEDVDKMVEEMENWLEQSD